jgi:hypothetical protein
MDVRHHTAIAPIVTTHSELDRVILSLKEQETFHRRRAPRLKTPLAAQGDQHRARIGHLRKDRVNILATPLGEAREIASIASTGEK